MTGVGTNLEIIRHIREHGHASLEQEPYHFIVREDNDTIPGKKLITINYHQIKTKDDGSDPIIRQARGTIVDVTEPSNPKLVCLPFLRFYNQGQSQADPIDHSTAIVEVKHDGSLIKLYWYEGDWRVATRGTVSAMNEHKEIWDRAYEYAKANHRFDLDSLDRTKIYLFELVSPDNFIVVHYKKTQIYHLGTRCMETLEEVEIDIGIPKPDRFDLNDEQGLEKAVQALVESFKGHEMEGVIVRDSNWNRVKVKSPSYLLLHHSRDSNLPPDLLCLKIVLANEKEEVETGRPDLVDLLNDTETKFAMLVKVWNENHARLISKLKDSNDNKEFAKILKQEEKEGKLVFGNYHFQHRAGKIESIEDFFRSWVDSNSKLKDLLKEINRVNKKNHK